MSKSPRLDDLPLPERIEARDREIERALVRKEREHAKRLKEQAANPPITRAVTKAPNWSPVPQWHVGRAQLGPAKYETYAREGYMHNEIIFACIEELGTSAGEPKMMFRQGEEWRHEGEVIRLINNPNPFMDGFEFWATLIMHRSLAGNSYALKVRSGAGKVVQLWLLRPDRIRIVPGATWDRYIDHYDYAVGNNEFVSIPARDVIHWKTRHPLDAYYGMPPLMPVSGRTDLDNFMRDFVKAYFENAGVPGGLLSIKQKLAEPQIEEIKQRFRSEYGGPAGWHSLLVLDNAEASFTPMTQQMGARGLVVPELTKVSEERICAVFGVPPPLLGIMMENNSYANLAMLQRYLWDNTLAPLYQALSRRLTMSLAPDFAGVDEIAFDLSDVRALQEDADQVSTRIIKEVEARLRTVEEARLALGLPEMAPTGHTFLLPLNTQQILSSGSRAPDMPLLPEGDDDDEPDEMPNDDDMPMVARRNGSNGSAP